MARQSPERQRLLIRTYLLDQFCGPLCDAVLTEPEWRANASEHVIVRLRQENSLIEAVGTPVNWYRSHGLLRGALQTELQRTESAATICELHGRASRWLAENGFVEQALRHALVSGDLGRCSEIMADCLEAILNREDWLSLEDIADASG